LAFAFSQVQVVCLESCFVFVLEAEGRGGAAQTVRPELRNQTAAHASQIAAAFRLSQVIPFAPFCHSRRHSNDCAVLGL
jgi:hypothetical protein